MNEGNKLLIIVFVNDEKNYLFTENFFEINKLNNFLC